MSGRKEKIKQRYPLQLSRDVAKDVILGLKSIMEISRELSIDRNTIAKWVKTYRNSIMQINQNLSLPEMKKEKGKVSSRAKLEALEKENKLLKKQLFESNLKHEALNIMIDLAEDHYGIGVRKNSGAKQ